MASLGRHYPYALNRDMFLPGQARWGFPKNLVIQIGTTPYAGNLLVGWAGPYYSREPELRADGNGVVYRWFPPVGADPDFRFEYHIKAQDATKHFVSEGYLRMEYKGIQMGNILPALFDTYLPAPTKYSGTMNRFAPPFNFATISWQQLRGALWPEYPLSPTPN